MKLSFTVHGRPVAKQRVRHYVRKGSDKASTYTPQETVIYENLVAMEAIAAMKKQKVSIMSGPVSLIVVCYFAVPQARAKRINEGQAHTQRPDADNCLKAICDAGNSVIWSDDCIVYSKQVTKRWTHQEPRCEVVVEVEDDSVVG